MKIHILQHAEIETPGNIADWAAKKAHLLTYTRFYEAHRLPTAAQYDLLVVLGAPINVYQEAAYPWLIAEKECIRTAILSGKKVMGICFGSQLIADVLGARVYPNKYKEVGWFPVLRDPTANHPLMKNMPDGFPAFHWHGDTFDIPEGAQRTYSSSATPNQGFVYGDRVFAFQFHWEVNEENMAHNIPVIAADKDKGEYVQALDQMYNPEGFAWGRSITETVMNYLENV